MLLFHSILTFMKELYQSENQVFNPTRLLVLLHCLVGKDWAGPFFPPSKIFRSFYWSVTIVVFRFMLLFCCNLTLMNDRFQRENQVFKPNILFVLLHCGVGKDWAGPFFPPLLNLSIFYWSFRLLVCVTFSLYFNIYERPIPKWESSFQSNKIIGTSTLLGGERLGQPILPPPPPHSIMLGSFNLLFSLSVYVTLWLYLNNFEWPIPKRDQVFKPTS